MAAVTKKDIPEIGSFMPDLWQMVKDFWIPEEDDRYWDDLLDRAKELISRYNDDPFVIDMTGTVIDHLDKKWRKATGR